MGIRFHNADPDAGDQNHCGTTGMRIRIHNISYLPRLEQLCLGCAETAVTWQERDIYYRYLAELEQL